MERRKNFRRLKLFKMGGLLVLGAIFVSVSDAQSTKRCDYIVNTTPGTGANAACLDLTALQSGGTPIQVADNATRISSSGVKLCKNAFTVSTGGAADVVFIVDNSGSMWSNRAYVSATDTVFADQENPCTNSSYLGTGTLTYTVQDDRQGRTPPILNRTIALLNADPGTACVFAGDPYNSRGVVVKNAIDYLASYSPLSTAGVVGFARDTMNAQPPLQLNVVANVTQVKSKMLLDSIGSTTYANPLALAKSWLTNPAIIKNKKQAIVFISDGRPDDGNAGLNLVDASMPPIYSIFLGKITTPDTAVLKSLSDASGGLFFHVDPTKNGGIQTVMDSIIQKITATSLPQSVAITNSTVGQTSVAQNMAFDASGNLSLSLDSIIALNKGNNAFTVKVTLANGTVETYSFTIDANGPTAAQSSSSLACYDPPTLVMLNAQGQQDSVYSAAANSYTIQLKRDGTDLSSVTISAASKDSSLALNWGDSEYVLLPQTGNAAGVTTFQKVEPFNGRVNSPTAKNGTLEADANGVVTLYWVHPRDPQEYASYTLPSSKIPSYVGTILVNTLHPVTHGSNLGGINPTDLVIYGGIDTVVQVSNDSALVSGGRCITNCGLANVLPPGNGISFVLTTKAPYSYQMYVFDQLGQFVNKFAGQVDSTAWNTVRKAGSDSVVSVMTVPPVAQNGQQLGTGVYILKTTIHTIAEDYTSGGSESHVTASTYAFIRRAGYLHP